MSALNKMLVETLAIDPSELLDSLAMKDVSKWDSLTHIELIVGLEKLFGIELTQDDVVEMTSVGAIPRRSEKARLRGRLSDRKPPYGPGLE